MYETELFTYTSVIFETPIMHKKLQLAADFPADWKMLFFNLTGTINNEIR